MRSAAGRDCESHQAAPVMTTFKPNVYETVKQNLKPDVYGFTTMLIELRSFYLRRGLACSVMTPTTYP